MFLARVSRSRIYEPHQAQLAYLREPPESGRIHQPPHARRQGHIHSRRNSDSAADVPRTANFRDVEKQRSMHGIYVNIEDATQISTRLSHPIPALPAARPRAATRR